MNKQELFDLIKPCVSDNTALYGACGTINIEFGKLNKKIKALTSEKGKVQKELDKAKEEAEKARESLELEVKELKKRVEKKGKALTSDDALQQVLDLFMLRVQEGTASASDFNALKEIFGWTNKASEVSVELVVWDEEPANG